VASPAELRHPQARGLWRHYRRPAQRAENLENNRVNVILARHITDNTVPANALLNTLHPIAFARHERHLGSAR
jgi:hypothetical protein